MEGAGKMLEEMMPRWVPTENVNGFEMKKIDKPLKIEKLSLMGIDKLDLNNIKRASKVSEYLKSDGAMECYVGDSDNYTMLKLTVMRRGEYKDYVIAVDDRMLKNFKRINPSTFLFF